MAKLASTDIYGNIVIKGLTTTKATASSSVATQIPVFILSPASTEQQLVTRTPAQILSDIGAYAASNPSGYGTGTVTSVGGTGTVSGLSLSGTVTTTGNLTLSGTLSVAASNFSSQTANTFLAAPNGSAGAPTFRAVVAADLPSAGSGAAGIVSTSSQTFDGAKTFSSNPTISTAAGLLTFSGTTSNGLSFAAATTTINATPTTASTLHLFSQVTASGSTKTINIGTLSASGSTTAINIGSSTGTTTTIMGANLDYVTSAPGAANTGGLKIAVLSTDPGTKYSG